MLLSPNYDDFARAWDQGKNQVVFARLPADLDTPVSLMLKLAEARGDTFMLESVREITPLSTVTHGLMGPLPRKTRHHWTLCAP